MVKKIWVWLEDRLSGYFWLGAEIWAGSSFFIWRGLIDWGRSLFLYERGGRLCCGWLEVLSGEDLEYQWLERELEKTPPPHQSLSHSQTNAVQSHLSLAALSPAGMIMRLSRSRPTSQQDR